MIGGFLQVISTVSGDTGLSNCLTNLSVRHLLLSIVYYSYCCVHAMPSDWYSNLGLLSCHTFLYLKSEVMKRPGITARLRPFILINFATVYPIYYNCNAFYPSGGFIFNIPIFSFSRYSREGGTSYTDDLFSIK